MLIHSSDLTIRVSPSPISSRFPHCFCSLYSLQLISTCCSWETIHDGQQRGIRVLCLIGRRPKDDSKRNLHVLVRKMCFYCYYVSTVIMFLLLSCFYCYYVSTVIMFLLLCFYCYCVPTVIMFLLLLCFYCYYVSTVIMFLLLLCSYCYYVSTVIMFLLLLCCQRFLIYCCISDKVFRLR
jgi:hypothetical protein